MGVKGLLVGEFELRSSADRFYHLCRYYPQNVQTFSEHIQKWEVLEGKFGQHGVVIRWTYTQPDGKVYKVKERAEYNDETKQISLVQLEGDLADDYMNCVVSLQPITRQGQNDVIKWTIDYEKRRDDVPHPFQTLGLLLNYSDHIEAEHLKTAANLLHPTTGSPL